MSGPVGSVDPVVATAHIADAISVRREVAESSPGQVVDQNAATIVGATAFL